MSIDHISENYGSHSLQKSNFEPKKRTEDSRKSPSSAPGTAARADEVKISGAAQELQRRNALAAAAGKALAGLPETGLDKVRTDSIAARIFSNYYDRPDVLTRTAAEMLEDGGRVAGPEARTREANTTGETEAVRWEKIAEVKSRIENNFYASREVLESIAREMLT